MEQETKKLKNNNKTIWQFFIAFMVILLVVLAGSIIIILLQGGHAISGKEVVHKAAFPLVIFIPMWVLLLGKIGKPTPKQEKIIKTMLIAALILLGANVLVFWLF
ncbi:hypothetical protein KJA16_03055 [Patescibacteria group bacterium]|nr:hypothetical protein [Patescibacteria group bacterium]